ncbi:MAG: GTP-binding protein [Saprospiraceae bacterium]|nr:GTP-binding protein [Saprospiraceae bacterium]
MDLLKIATAGSVDDGKSTLIGRLLYETGAIKEDQLRQIEQKSRKSGFDYIDFSLVTDGLLTEREQGITIDVSHIFLNTPSRRFVIADSPGHLEYTRNMITGASTAELSLILADARKGITPQTRRHLYLSLLLGIKHIVLCVNKMDLVDYEETRFNDITEAFAEMVRGLNPTDVSVASIPVSALHGVNIAEKSPLTGWYAGLPLLQLLQKVSLSAAREDEPVFQVQYVLRPRTSEWHDYRAYLGKLRSGVLRSGDEVYILPEGYSATIKQLEQYGQTVEAVHAGENCSVLLDGEFSVSRGQLIAGLSHRLKPLKRLEATICWMDNQPLIPGKKLWLQYGSQLLQARVQQLLTLVDTGTFGPTEQPGSFKLNDIGNVDIQLAECIYVQPYDESRANGAFILIDEQSNATVAVGFVR